MQGARGIAERGARDFFDALVASGMLDRDGAGRYANTADTDVYLDRAKPSYIGGELEHAQLIAELATSPLNHFGRVGARIHPVDHPAFAQEAETLISRAGELMGISLYDHIIVSRAGFVSLKEKGLL